jgi:hypothetical protein
MLNVPQKMEYFQYRPNIHIIIDLRVLVACYLLHVNSIVHFHILKQIFHMALRTFILALFILAEKSFTVPDLSRRF